MLYFGFIFFLTWGLVEFGGGRGGPDWQTGERGVLHESEGEGGGVSPSHINFCICSHHQQLPSIRPTPPPHPLTYKSGRVRRKPEGKKDTNQTNKPPPPERRLSAYPGLDDKQIITCRPPKKLKRVESEM